MSIILFAPKNFCFIHITYSDIFVRHIPNIVLKIYTKYKSLNGVFTYILPDIAVFGYLKNTSASRCFIEWWFMMNPKHFITCGILEELFAIFIFICLCNTTLYSYTGWPTSYGMGFLWNLNYFYTVKYRSLFEYTI